MKKIKKYLLESVYRIFYILGMEKIVSNIIYFRYYKKGINWKNPCTLNEKLMVIKHKCYMDNILISKCADKYGVREYVKSKGCNEVLTELCDVGIYDSVDQISWETLPSKFAIKCTHGCKMNIIVPDKSIVKKECIYKQLLKWQKQKFGYLTGEWHYLAIKPRIICEKFYGTSNGKYPVDYKFFCMNGKVTCIETCSERENGKANLIFMDKNWNRLYIDTAKLDDSYIEKKPDSFSDMLKYAEILSADFPFVRVDFYEYKGKVLLSELTFTPSFNCIHSIDNSGQILLGKMLKVK